MGLRKEQMVVCKKYFGQPLITEHMYVGKESHKQTFAYKGETAQQQSV